MASLYPREPTVEPQPREATKLDLTDEPVTEVLEALASETSREILDRLDAEPAPASDVAEDLDTSVQNVHYHLDRLQEADLVAQVTTWYSSRGKEMAVYAPTIDRLTIRLGNRDRGQHLQ